MLCLELDMIVMNLYRDLLQKMCIQTFSSRGEMLCICNKFDVLFCLCIILSVIYTPTKVKHHLIFLSIYTEYYMSKSVSHAVATREPYITPRATGPRGDIDRGMIRRVIQILTCNVQYIIYFSHAFDNTCVL